MAIGKMKSQSLHTSGQFSLPLTKFIRGTQIILVAIPSYIRSILSIGKTKGKGNTRWSVAIPSYIRSILSLLEKYRIKRAKQKVAIPSYIRSILSAKKALLHRLAKKGMSQSLHTSGQFSPYTSQELIDRFAKDVAIPSYIRSILSKN